VVRVGQGVDLLAYRSGGRFNRHLFRGLASNNGHRLANRSWISQGGLLILGYRPLLEGEPLGRRPLVL
jgi:hypothetical protein